MAVGIKGGVKVPRMLYWQSPTLGQLPQDTLLTPTGGLFVEIPLGRALMVAPEAVYVQRGTGLKYTHHSGSEVHYTMNVHCVDLRVPVELRWPISPYFQPYLALGAEVGMRLGGKIAMTRTAPIPLNDTLPVGNANMSLIQAGAFAGVGIRSRIDLGDMDMIVKLSASYHQDLLDTYSKAEKGGAANAQNVNAYHVEGSRLPQGLEATLGIAIPLERKPKDACASFGKDRYRRHGPRGHLYGY